MASLAADPESHRAAAAVFKPAAPKAAPEKTGLASRSGRILPSLAEVAVTEDPPTPETRKEPAKARRFEERVSRPRTTPREADTQQHRVALENLFAKKPTAPLSPEPLASEILPDLTSVFSVKVQPPAATLGSEAPKPVAVRAIKAPKAARKAPVVLAPPAVIVVKEAPPVAETSSRARKRAIVGRYVLRDESEPGQNWKRRLLARRESRS